MKVTYEVTPKSCKEILEFDGNVYERNWVNKGVGVYTYDAEFNVQLKDNIWRADDDELLERVDDLFSNCMPMKLIQLCEYEEIE